MSKSLIMFRTHFLSDAIVGEFEKLRSSTDNDCIIFYDNHNHDIVSNNNEPFCQITYKDYILPIFLFDTYMVTNLNLPLFSAYGNDNISKVMWYNSDYPFYIIKNYYPSYDYYWQIEYDVFCNGNSYKPFFDRYNNSNADLLIGDYRNLKNNMWGWEAHSDWIYENNTEKYGSFFPVVRLSNNAIEFLYKRKLEHKSIFEKSTNPDKKWCFVEFFVPTELTNNGFLCENLNENLRYEPVYNLNIERIFEHPDFKLYHPVK